MIVYFFIDGVGFGENDIEKNPFAKFAKGFFLPLANKPLPTNSKLTEGAYIKTDASMGIKGLPQSATGQTAIWTGINAPQVLKRHISGYPTFTLRKIIDEFSILKVLEDRGKKAAFLNCYSPIYFENVKKKPKHVSASTMIQQASKIPFRNMEDLRNNNGVFMDISHEFFREFAKDFLPPGDSLLNLRDPYEVGKNVVNIAQNYDLVLFEYFLTDKIGHDQNWEMAEKVIHTVERFIDGIHEAMDKKNHQLIITSDHGNLEDLTVSTHSVNPVPTYLYGNLTEFLKNKISSLSDIVPALYEKLGIEIELKWDAVKE
ncbi:MAG: alkaline phosphatase family protein [Leptospiraceae bacterium]|nr:alkaline phosphatase family protein [Leptospiraceae bacterium]